MSHVIFFSFFYFFIISDTLSFLHKKQHADSCPKGSTPIRKHCRRHDWSFKTYRKLTQKKELENDFWFFDEIFLYVIYARHGEFCIWHFIAGSWINLGRSLQVKKSRNIQNSGPKEASYDFGIFENSTCERFFFSFSRRIFHVDVT